MAVSFKPFGSAHFGVVALTFITPLALSAVVRWSESAALARFISLSLVALLVGAKVLRLVLLAHDNELTIENAIPMHLCDWAAILVVVTLICPKQWTYELCYFWALAGTSQALLTPDLPQGFPDLRFVSFFALHGGVIAAVLYMTLGLGMRPVPISIVRALAWSFLYLCVAMATNAIFHTNFGYLSAKPAHPSLLDYMARWPFYIAELALVAVLSCLICYAPFFLLDRLRAK